ncbi:hypothetical protein Emag_001585 [Eimeria magna]
MDSWMLSTTHFFLSPPSSLAQRFLLLSFYFVFVFYLLAAESLAEEEEDTVLCFPLIRSLFLLTWIQLKRAREDRRVVGRVRQLQQQHALWRFLESAATVVEDRKLLFFQSSIPALGHWHLQRSGRRMWRGRETYKGDYQQTQLRRSAAAAHDAHERIILKKQQQQEEQQFTVSKKPHF